MNAVKDRPASEWQLAIDEAVERLRGRVIKTPLLRALALEKAFDLNTPLYLKLENTQHSGAFKYRAALNGILSHFEAAKSAGVVASSSGNYARAVAMAARELGVRATIVMMPTSAAHKVSATKELGAEVVFCENDYAARQVCVEEVLKERGGVELHPHSSFETIVANGSLAREIGAQMRAEGFEATWDLLVPASGGGLLAGCCLLREREGYKDLRVFATQPSGNLSLYESLKRKQRWRNPAVQTQADAIQADCPGPLAFEVFKNRVDGCLIGREENLLRVMDEMEQREGLIVEHAGALALTALLDDGAQLATDSKRPVVCVVSGGNRAAPSPS